ncbi:outer membrane protein assembly factor BamE [Salinisphaera sp. SPP-AMP-43]|uniref:outer membrane protein assembly factor BamE domain-containing protein n=1 Tax=Salinisphaera sp. SPP-AMP-43 TaxID=3121288 RepID=UPI003C6E15C0
MKLIAALVMLLALSACSLPVFFRVPIVQGNIVTADQVAKLEQGMTKKQVAYVLGTPLIKSPFEANRWDYVFYYRNPNAHVRQSKLDLYFVDDKLSDIEGNEEYSAETMKLGDRPDSTDSGQLPAGTSAAGASLGVGSEQSQPTRPATNAASDQATPRDNTAGTAQPVTPGNQPGNNGPMSPERPVLPPDRPN